MQHSLETHNFMKIVYTWCYVNNVIVLEIRNESGNPCIQIVVSTSDVVDAKLTFFVCSCPKLICLKLMRFFLTRILFFYSLASPT